MVKVRDGLARVVEIPIKGSVIGQVTQTEHLLRSVNTQPSTSESLEVLRGPGRHTSVEGSNSLTEPGTWHIRERAGKVGQPGHRGSPHPCGLYGVTRPGNTLVSMALDCRSLIRMGSIFLSQGSTRR
jgi:hypothetical protein